ncbi:MAG: site-2 protease family protein [Phenylobacterium sp.]|uniref:site-2 protease family protein n=1 Tax=Phenylobacterium sp. TaxID=1871053 RepID=UPI00391A2E24
MDTPQDTAPASSSLAGPLLLLAWLSLGAALVRWPQFTGVLTFAFVMVGWVLAVAVHEFGHALTAYVAGDHSVRAKGYLSFDPRRYTDLGVSIVIPLIALALGGIGFPGGAVYLREDLMRSRAWRSLASLAGPFGTLVVLIVLTRAMPLAAGASTALYDALAFLAFLQATALVLNLAPIPGFDGYGAIRPWLPGAVARALAPIEGLAVIAFLGLLFLLPGAAALLFGAAFVISESLDAPIHAVRAGWEAFRFWR